jgi:hypothetical protein
MTWLEKLSQWFGEIPTTDLVIGSVLIGLLLALTAMFLHKYSISKIIAKMEKDGIHTPDKALTLKELGANVFVRSAISDGGSVRRLFGYTLGDQIVDNPRAPLPNTKGRKDLSAARFYLLPSKRAEATTRFPKRGNSPLTFVICIILLLVGAYAIREMLPAFLEFLAQSTSAGTGA